MTSLGSVAVRELRVAARKRSAFRLRVVTASVALVVSGFTLWFVTFFGASPIPGSLLFRVLSWVVFGCACLAGCGLTADSISEEKRNGTLELLFLTHLRGPAILLGKLAAHGLLGCYSMLAVIPVIALPVLLGGADIASLIKTSLAISLTLLLGLASGLFASTISRRGWTASALSLFVMGFFVLALPAASEIALLLGHLGWAMPLELLSPSYSLAMANWTARGLSNNRFWSALGLQLILTLLLLAGATGLISRLWREEAPRAGLSILKSMIQAWRFGGSQSRRRLRQKLLARNPVLWLCARQRFGSASFCLLILLVGTAVSLSGRVLHFKFGAYDDFLSPLVLWIWAVPLLYILFCLRLAAAASERFAADRKSGALELLLCTPLSVKEIVRGHWLALFRRCWGGALMLLLVHGFALFYLMEAFALSFQKPFGWRQIIGAPLAQVFFGKTIGLPIAGPYIICLAILMAAFLIVVLWIALGWLGLFLAFKIPREIFAPWAAMALLAIPPIPIFITFAVTAISRKWFFGTPFPALLFLGAGGFFIVLANAVAWIFIARAWIHRKLRRAASGELKSSGKKRSRSVASSSVAYPPGARSPATR